MEFDDPEYASGKKGDKKPMYEAAPEDNAPVARRTFLCTAGIMALLMFGLLVVVIMCLNGTIPPVNDWYYLKPAQVKDMDKFEVVKHYTAQCRQDLPLNLTTLTLSPDPLILPDKAFDTEYEMDLVADMPKEISIQAMVQRLEPPWRRVPCVNNQGSCIYENACKMVGQIFGKESCEDLTKGKHKGKINARMIDMMGPLGFIKPGNYFVHARINFRDETFGCMVMSFRVRGKPEPVVN